MTFNIFIAMKNRKQNPMLKKNWFDSTFLTFFTLLDSEQDFSNNTVFTTIHIEYNYL